MENLFLDAFFENVPWRFKKTDVKQVEKESVEIPEIFLKQFPEMSGLLMVTNKFRIELNDKTIYNLYGWDSFRMTSLLGAMLLFYGLGWVLYSVLNYFDRENEKRLAAETALPEEDEAVEGESESATIE